MIYMKKVRFASPPRANVRRQGPPGYARAQPVVPLIVTECKANATLTRFI